MKIVREGKEIELTWQELFEANQEYQRDCMFADVAQKADEMEIELSMGQIERAGRIAQKALDNNDITSESYWMAIENAEGSSMAANGFCKAA